jgi:transposase InsO family protein
VEVQAFERHREWSRREAEAYHTIFRYLSPHISIHVAGLETSRDLWNELEERYRRMELATFCELFAQLRETTGERCASARDFVDRVRLLVHRLNAIAPGSIGDKTHIAILLTQIGPEYILVVDAIQNDKDPVNPTTIGNRLSNAEQTVRRKESPVPPQGIPGPSINAVQRNPKKCTYCRKRGHVVAECWKKQREIQSPRDHALKAERSASGSPRNNMQNIPSSQREDRQGPPTSKRPRINIVRARVTTLYTHAPQPRWILDSAATSHICWDRSCFSSLRPHREMLDTAGDPVEAEGIGTVKLTLRGKFNQPLVLKNVYFAPRVGMNLISVPKLLRDRYSVVAHPQNVFVQRRGRTVGTAYHAEEDLLILRCHVSKRSRERVQLARAPTTCGHADSLEPQAVAMEVDDPQESSDAECAASTSELSGEAVILEEDACKGVDQASEALWHARMGHLNRGDLRVVLRQTGTPYRPLTQAQLLATPQCPACMSGKQHQKRNSRARRPRLHSTRIFEMIHSDIMEMPIAKDGSRYVITFTDDYSRGSWAYAMRWKHEALQKFRLFAAWVHRQFGAQIKRFLTDNGREYLPIGAHLETQGVEFDTSPPYCKGQNGLAERTNRTIRERINTLLSDANLPPSWWTELLETVVYLKLRAPASILQKKTPYEIIYGKPPSLLHLRRIGSCAWVLIPKEHRAKLGPRSSECRLLGYCEPNQYKLYEIHSGKTVFSRDVEFDERTPVAPLIEGESVNDLPDNAPPSSVFPSVPSLANGLPTPPVSPLPLSSEQEKTPSQHGEEIPPPVNPIEQEAESTQDLGYSVYGRRRRPSRRLLESLGKVYSTGTLNPAPARQVDPVAFREAVSGSDQLEWWAAIQKEYASLLEHGTWEKARREDVPAGDHVIGCKWVFKTKVNGTRKARLVIKGYRQKHGIDYHETFAAVSRMDSVRCIIASAALRGWKLHQFDAVTAFLHGDVDSSIYMELPEGFEEPGYVCRLRRSLYGLKQAPRIWYQCVHRVLAAHGFTMAESDNCVFYKSDCVVCVYVDDFLITAANSHEIKQVQQALEKEFQLNDLGTPRSFLGIQFDYHADGGVSIHQHQYIQKILSDFGMETCQAKTTPMNPKQVLNYHPDEAPPDEEAKARFATAIGSLMYLMVGTRPDIAFALGTLSRFTSQPQSHHQVALQRLLRYVKATQYHRITYRSGQLIGYTDADFGGSVVTDGAYSTSGYVFQLAGAPVSWSSKRQGEVATSTTHAEYIGQYNAILHLQWLRTFLAETQLYRSPVTNIMADNQSAIALSRNPEFHKRTKHFNVKFHYQRAVLNAGEIGLQYVPTEEQAADGLTKPLGPTAFAKFCSLLGIEALETQRQQT